MKSGLHLVEKRSETELDRYIREFLLAKSSRKPSTLRFYELPLRQYRAHVGPAAWPPTDSQINDYLATCRRRGLKQNTLNAYYRAIKIWLGWLIKRRIISLELDLIERQRPVRKIPRAPRLSIVEDFFKAIRANPEEWRRRRDLALFQLFFDTGLRIGEAAHILLTDVDFETLEIYIPETKTGEERVVVFSSSAASSLADWLEARATLPAHEIPTLFVAYATSLGRWGTFKPDAIRQAKDRYLIRAGLPNMRVHDFRHLYAIWTLRNGGNLLDVQRQLGHRDISTTSIYLQAADSEERGRRHQKSSPLANL